MLYIYFTCWLCAALPVNKRVQLVNYVAFNTKTKEKLQMVKRTAIKLFGGARAQWSGSMGYIGVHNILVWLALWYKQRNRSEFECVVFNKIIWKYSVEKVRKRKLRRKENKESSIIFDRHIAAKCKSDFSRDAVERRERRRAVAIITNVSSTQKIRKYRERRKSVVGRWLRRENILESLRHSRSGINQKQCNHKQL